MKTEYTIIYIEYLEPWNIVFESPDVDIAMKNDLKIKGRRRLKYE